MASQNCIYKAVTMKAGEVFVLPPGAELISVTDANAVTSSCSDDLPESDFKCYRIRWILDHNSPHGAKTMVSGFTGPTVVQVPNINNAWDDSARDSSSITIPNISIAGDVITATSVNARDMSALEAVISSSSSGAVLTDRRYLSGFARTSLNGIEAAQWENPLASGWDDGYDWYDLYFKTTEDIAKLTYIEFNASSGNVGHVPRYYPLEVDCNDYPTTSDVNPCGENSTHV